MGIVRTRSLAPDEWTLFRDLRLRALLDAPDAFGGTYAASTAMDEHAWRGWLTGDGWQGDVSSFVAENHDGPLGIATCAVFDAEPGVAELFSMWVAPDGRGRGAGRALVRAVADHARERGCERVLLRVSQGNEAAATLYASCGFVDAGTPPKPLRDGSAVRTVQMYLPLR